MAVIPEYEAQLLVAAERQAFRERDKPTFNRRARTTSRFAATSFAVGLFLTGSAYAARGAWLPALGWHGSERPTVTTTKPATKQTDSWAAFRRSQTALDRGENVRSSLRLLGNQQQGVNLDYVRLLGTTPEGGAIVAFTAQRSQTAGNGADRDAVCLLVGGGTLPFGGTVRCAPASSAAHNGIETQYTFRPGIGRGVLDPTESTEVGLVPDDVVAVAVGRVGPRVAVNDNHYVLQHRTVDPGAAQRLWWIYRNGTRRPAGD